MPAIAIPVAIAAINKARILIGEGEEIKGFLTDIFNLLNCKDLRAFCLKIPKDQIAPELYAQPSNLPSV
jgi:hypothetical protein